jgi:hypothetical protein
MEARMSATTPNLDLTKALAVNIAGELVDGAKDSMRFQRNILLVRWGGGIVLLMARMALPLLLQLLIYRLVNQATERAGRPLELTAYELKIEHAPTLPPGVRPATLQLVPSLPAAPEPAAVR